MEYFDRRIKLSIEINGSLLEISEEEFLDGNLAIEFEIKKANDNYSSNGQISITGLTIDDVAFLGSAYDLNTGQYKQSYIKLEAGYVGNTTILLEGNIIECKADLTSPDTKVVLKCMAGAYNNLKAKDESISLKDSPLEDILKKIANLNDMNYEIDKELSSKIIPVYSFHGKPFSHIDNFVNNFNNLAKIFIDNNKIFMLKDSTSPITSTIIELANDSGLIGVPNYTPAGCEIVSLLNPSFQVNGHFKLTNLKIPKLNGIYRIMTLEFVGGNRSANFYCNILGRLV